MVGHLILYSEGITEMSNMLDFLFLLSPLNSYFQETGLGEASNYGLKRSTTYDVAVMIKTRDI